MTSDVPNNLGAQAVPGGSSLFGVDAPRRGPVHGRRFGVAADHPLASTAAMTMLQRGGTAGDAVVAAAAVNCVCKPYATQLGGDAFALVWRRKANTVECMNAGGLAPKSATLASYSDGIPGVGPRSVTVPGFIDGLMEIYKGYATLPLATLFAPAIRYAEEGFPISLRLHDAIALIPGLPTPDTEELRRVYLKPDGSVYRTGEILRQPELAETLKRIADLEREGFYEDETADLIAKAMAESGGHVALEDMKEPLAHWHDPLMTTYKGLQVYEQALPSQGMILLEALNIVEGFPLDQWGSGTADSVHVMAEAMKLAFADRRAYAADPLVETVPIDELLSKEHAKLRAKEIDLRRAKDHGPGPMRHDTTSFVAADEDTAIAFIQTVFSVWGSRFVIPGTGVLMTNRLSGFSSDPSSPNRLEPGKRTVHTLNNFLAIRDGELVIGGGTPGADFQVQTNLQTIAGVQDWGLDVQSALDMPRWVITGDGSLAMESRYNDSMLGELASRGHRVQRLSGWDATVSRSQVMASLPEEGWAFGSDLRGEGVALAE